MPGVPGLWCWLGIRDGKEQWEKGMEESKGCRAAWAAQLKEKGPAEAGASLGKPQMCWSWTLLQVPQAPGDTQRHLCGSRSVQGEKSMGQLRHLEKLHPIHPILHLFLPQQETGTATLRAPHLWQLHPKTTQNRLEMSQGARASNFPLFPLPHIHISCLAREELG